MLLSAVSEFVCLYCKCKVYSEKLLINETVLPETTVIDLMSKLYFDNTEGKFALHFSVC